MDVLPALVVLSAVEQRDIRRAELFSDVGEVGAVAAVAAEEDAAVRRFQHEAGPQGLVLRESATGIVAGRDEADANAVQVDAVAPVGLADALALKAPAPKMRARAESARDKADARFQRRDRGVVQVIPVIVGDEQSVNVGHVLRRAGRASGKGPRAERHRRGVIAEHRINEQALAAQLEKKAGMPEPDHEVFGAAAREKVGLFGGNRRARRGIGALFHERAEQRARKGAVVAEHGALNEVVERSVGIVG